MEGYSGGGERKSGDLKKSVPRMTLSLKDNFPRTRRPERNATDRERIKRGRDEGCVEGIARKKEKLERERGTKNMEKSTTNISRQTLLERGRKEFVERVVDMRKEHGERKANKTADEGKEAEGRW